MRIVITGGLGFVGAALARRLLARGGVDSLALLDAPGAAEPAAGLAGQAEIVRGDIRDAELVRGVIRGADTLASHREILDRIASHDAGGARAAMRTHLDKVEEHWRLRGPAPPLARA